MVLFFREIMPVNEAPNLELPECQDDVDEGFGSLDSDGEGSRPLIKQNSGVSEGTQTDDATSSTSSDIELVDDEDEGILTNLERKVRNKVNCVLGSNYQEVGTQTWQSPIQREADILAHDIVSVLLKKSTPEPTSEVVVTMRRCVHSILDKHSLVFSAMTKKLQITPKTGYATFVGVADELFEGGITWGRIVTLYAFGGSLAAYCNENNMPNYSNDIAYFMGKFVGERLGTFILNHGGWEGLVREFPPERDMEKFVWKTLLVTGIGLGIATGASLLIAR